MSAETNFHYKGIAQGKYVEGDIEALNDAEAAHKLKDQKIIITKLVQPRTLFCKIYQVCLSEWMILQ